ncbi:MAG TPA: hypothetical protein VLT89_14300, partial [Usitatibacter sp.]|nr:hypothetical protein [Usitatibacter sp.]
REEPSVNRKEERRAQAALRQREAEVRKPFERKLATIEAELGPLEAEAAETEKWLASSEAYDEANRDSLQSTLKRRGEVAARIAQLEEDWLWTQAQMERALEA